MPNDTDLGNVGENIICSTALEQIAETADVVSKYDGGKSRHQINEWLLHHMGEEPFHQLCSNSSVTIKKINDYINANDNYSVLAINTIHGMTPLHMLVMNLHASSDSIVALLSYNMQAIFCVREQKLH